MLLTAEDIAEFNKNLNAFEKFMNELPEKALSLGIRAVIAAITFLIGMKFISFVRKLVRKSLVRASAETGVIQFLDALIKIVLYMVLILGIASSFGFDATSVVTLVGSAGVTIGLALQGSMSNLAGGVLILLLKPFRVGDYIVEDSKKNEGTVKEIGIFYTKLQTLDNHIVVLPNGTLANSSLTNYSESPLRRIDLAFGIAYDTDIRKAKQVIEQVVNNDPDVDKKENITVIVDSLGSSEIVIGLKCYCLNEKYWQVRWRLIENAKIALDDAGIEIPYQQLCVHMK